LREYRWLTYVKMTVKNKYDPIRVAAAISVIMTISREQQ